MILYSGGYQSQKVLPCLIFRLVQDQWWTWLFEFRGSIAREWPIQLGNRNREAYRQ